MKPTLLKNGLKFCDAGEPVSLDSSPPAFVILTDKRVLAMPGDVFEYSNTDVRFRVSIIRSMVTNEGWETTCRFEG
ncbi:hypothetical protein [Luteolibacter soli]|uniref:Uncharacterized protein n=1 Tax=Luteolibacter soli TaxID=3135280 RepID=A0ABU9B2S5_9BACT